MISYKYLTNIIKSSNMTLINRYSSTYIHDKLSNISYEDIVNKKSISINKIDNKNVGEDSYIVKAVEDNKDHILIPVLQPNKYNYNILNMSKLLSFQDIYPEVYSKNINDIIIKKKCNEVDLDFSFDKDYTVIDFNTDRIEVCENDNLVEEYQLFKNSFYCYNRKENRIELNRLNGKSIIYKNIKVNKLGEPYLSTLPSIVIDKDKDTELKYTIKYYNSGMVKEIKNNDGEILSLSDCGKDSGFSFYNLLFDPFNIWNNARNNLYSLWSLSWFANTKRDVMLYSNDIYIIKITDLDKILSFIKKYNNN